MQKNYVIIKHLADNGKFLFQVPDEVELIAGEKVVCETSRGSDQLGVCCCNSFFTEPDVILPLFGTVENNMKYVTGKIAYIRFSETKDDDNGK